MPVINIGGYSPRNTESNSKLALAAQMRREPSPGEAAFWAAVREWQLAPCGEPARVNRQQVIRGYIADFYFPEYRAIAEIDGDQHSDDAAWNNDLRRDEVFRRAGYSVFRIRNRLVLRDVELVRELVGMYLETVRETPGYYRGHNGFDEERTVRAARLWWSFQDYGILERIGRDDEHWFRVTEDMPDDFDVEFGGEVGATDCHPVWACVNFACALRFGL